MPPYKAEYIWVDGTRPTALLRSKTKIIWDDGDLPTWGFDGSSTNQAPGHASDCILKPVYVCDDPIRGGNDKLALCEVFNADGTPHETNTRARLREVVKRNESHVAWFGWEQEYTMWSRGRPLGWPENGYPAPQGPFYCGVGADEVFGREIVEEHLELMLAAGMVVSGINAEVMPGQWEYQIGPLTALEASDELWLSRWLLYRVGEDHDVSMTLDPKPMRGDWNGAGCHTNFSTKEMREPGGLEHIYAAMKGLEARHHHHIENYGDGIERRLTGAHETCHYSEFAYGVGHRGASIRIPLHVEQAGHGYLEDRRPCANIDPYTVARLLIETICEG